MDEQEIFKEASSKRTIKAKAMRHDLVIDF